MSRIEIRRILKKSVEELSKYKGHIVWFWGKGNVRVDSDIDFMRRKSM